MNFRGIDSDFTLGKIPHSETVRQELRSQVRSPLTTQFRKFHFMHSPWLFLRLTSHAGSLTGKPDAVVPWSNIWKAAVEHRLVVIGCPLNRPLTDPLIDPTDLLIDELRAVAAAVRKGDCRFARVTDDQFEILNSHHWEDVEAGQIAPQLERQGRSDNGETRGAHLHPDTRTKTRANGKIICSDPYVDSDIENEEVEWSAKAKKGLELSSDPIEDWGW